MITDVLFKRYPDRWIYADGLAPELTTLLRQTALVLHEDISPKFPDRTQLYESAHKLLCRELGIGRLAPGSTHEEQCIRYLGEPYDLWNDSHGRPDSFFKLRLSLVELLFREAEDRVRVQGGGDDLLSRFQLLQKRIKPRTRSSEESALEAVVKGVSELNERFRQANLPFEYHNGLVQRINDPVTTAYIETPFWALVSEPKWGNVDQDMKEAVDRRDAGKGDAAFLALKALESALKILSDDLGVTRGSERGASDFIDNLVSRRNGRFIEVWEAEALKHLFRELRNPQGHGPGSATPLVLDREQSSFVLESCMAWVKSLVRRLP